MEGELYLNVIFKSPVGKVDDLLGFTDFVSPYQPQILVLVEFCIFTLLLHFGGGKVWHCLEIVQSENLADLGVAGVVEHSEEGRGLKVCLLVGVRYALVLREYVVAAIAALLNGEEGHDVVWPGVLQDKVFVLVNSEADEAV